MATAHDVARYILQKHGAVSAMKFQKLLYYSQAWSLVWDEKPMFSDRIEAWVNGPVVPEIYQYHKGQFQIDAWPHGKIGVLSASEIETVDSVLKFYGHRTGQWLSDLTHREKPWMDARQGLDDSDRGGNEISLASMHDYYASL